MAVHTTTHNSDVSLEQEFQKHLSDASHKHSILDNVKLQIISSLKKWKNR